MPVLTPKQADALRIANRDDLITTEQAHPAVLTSLYKRGFLRGEGWLGSNRCYAPTDAAIEVMEQYDKAIETVQKFSQGVNRTLLSLTAPADGCPGTNGIPNYDVGAIVEPDPSEADTEPLEPIIPTAIMTAEHQNALQSYIERQIPPPINPQTRSASSDTVKTDYKTAWRGQRLLKRLDGINDDIGIDIVVGDIDLGDIPIDLCIAANESLVARQTPDPEPFMMRVWWKRMEDALDALERIGKIDIWNDKAFDNKVLDYKFAKSRYMWWDNHFCWSIPF